MADKWEYVGPPVDEGGWEYVGPPVDAQAKPEENGGGIASSIGGWIADKAKGLKQSITGPDNLKYKGAGDVMDFLNKQSFFDPNAHGLSARILGAKFAAQSDEGYANIIDSALRKAYPDKYAGRTKDNGYDVFLIREGDKVVPYYANKPGLDTEDIQRAVTSLVPYVGGAKIAAGAVGKGAGLLAGAAAQGAAAGATSMASDLAARQMGSDETYGTSLKRAMMAMAGGAGGEVTGRALQGAARLLASRKLIDASGNLTEAGIAEAKKAGINPDVLNEAGRRTFAKLQPKAQDASALRRKVEMESAGIQGTTGDYTKRLDDLMFEEKARKGLLGKTAQQIIDPALQAKAPLQKAQAERMGQYIEGKAAPDAGIPSGTTVDEAGSGIQSTIQGMHSTDMAPVKKAFEGVSPYHPTKAEVGSIGDELSNAYKAGDERIISALSALENGNKTLKHSAQAMAKLRKFSSFKLMHPVDPSLTGKALKQALKANDRAAMDVIQLRRELAATRDAAFKHNQNDGRVASRVLEIVDDWIVKNADNMGDGVMKKYLEAMDLSRKVNAKYGPVVKGGKPDKGGEWIRNLVQNNDLNPARIVSDITGNNMYAPQRIARLKKLLGLKSPEMAAVKAVYLDKFFKNSNGQFLPPKTMIPKLESMVKQTAYKKLFTETEKVKIAQMIHNVKRMDRPELSQTELQAINSRLKDILMYSLKRKGTHETFQANTIRGSIYHMLARTIAKTPGGSLISAGKAARHARGEIPVVKIADPTFPAMAAQGKAQEVKESR